MGDRFDEIQADGWEQAKPVIDEAMAGRAKRRDLSRSFVTGDAENAIIGNGHLEPGMQVLTKPFAVDTLAPRIFGSSSAAETSMKRFAEPSRSPMRSGLDRRPTGATV